MSTNQTSRTPRAVVALLLAVGLLGGCGAAPVSGPAPTVSDTPTLPVVLPACVRPEDGTPTRVTTSLGMSDGVMMGQGPRGVVIAHQVNDGMCNYLDLARDLVDRGYRVALYSQVDPSSDIPGWTGQLAAAGASKVVLLGASIGAMGSLQVAQDLAPPVTGVISLSALSGLDGNLYVDDVVSRLRLPVLFIASEDDPDGGGPTARGFMKLCPSRDKQVLVVPGSDHGIGVTLGPSRVKVLPRIHRFLARHA